MDHAHAERLAPLYDAGKLGREETRALHAHFKDCPVCRARISLRRAAAKAGPAGRYGDLVSDDTQRQIARNRDLLIKILMLGLGAWAFFKWKR